MRLSVRDTQTIQITHLSYVRRQLLRLMTVLRESGAADVFLSVYESGSIDQTPLFLRQLRTHLDQLGFRHRIVIDDTPRTWEYEFLRATSALERQSDNAITPYRIRYGAENATHFCNPSVDEF